MPARNGSESPSGSFAQSGDHFAEAAAHEHLRHQHRRPVLTQTGQTRHPDPFADLVRAQQQQGLANGFDPIGPVECR